MPTRAKTVHLSLLLSLFAWAPRPIDAQELCGAWEVVEGFALDDVTSLTDVAVVSPEDVWAVGSHRSSGSLEDTPFSVHFDGTSWSVVEVPCPAHPLDVDCSLGGVSAAAADDVWAVGSFKHPDEFDLEPFVVHWDGQQWSWVPAPTQPDGEGARLFDVRAIASDDVWAVGTWPGEPAGGQSEPLAMHWDGQSWEAVFVPYVGELSFETTSLHRIAVVASDDVWAIGNRSIGLTPHRPYIVRWDGAEWRIMETRPEPLYRSLTDIAVFGSDDVWISALKHDEQDPLDSIPVLLHWDGASWTEVADPGDPLVGSSQFAGVAADDIWASANGELSHFDGTTWSRVADLPDPTLELPLVINFEPVSACEAWGAGQHTEGNVLFHLRPLGQPQSVDLTSFAVRRGLIVGGDLAALLDSDDDHLEVDADRTGDRFVIQTLINARSPLAPAGRLDVEIEVSADAPGARGRVALWDWDARTWRPVSTFSITTSDEIHTALAVPDAASFVRADNGSIRIQLQAFAASAQAPDGFLLRVDRIALEVTP